MPIIPIIIIVLSIILIIAAFVQDRKTQKQFNSFLNTYTAPYMLGDRIAANRMYQTKNKRQTIS